MYLNTNSILLLKIITELKGTEIRILFWKITTKSTYRYLFDEISTHIISIYYHKMYFKPRI